MTNNKLIQSVSFLAVFALFLGLVAWLLWPSFYLLTFAAMVAVLFHPVYRFFLRKIKSPTMAGLLTILVVLFLIAIPIGFFGNLIFSEIFKILNYLRSSGLVIPKDKIIHFIPDAARGLIQNLSVELNNYVGRLANQFFTSATGVLTNIAGFFVSFFMFFFVLFFLLKDGEKMMSVLLSISPLAPTQADHILTKIKNAVKGIIQGNFIIALIQGVISTIGYYLVGLPEPLIWGSFTIVAALIPTVGTSLVLVPAIVFLIVTGNIPHAIGLAIWGGVAVGLVDNFIGPKLIGRKLNIHPLLIFLGVIGGINVFGVMGVLLGPIIMSVFMAMIDIYRTEFKDYTNQ